jgi:hypothetical protein
MTLDEARSHIGRTVIYQSGTGEAEEYLITDVATYYVFARSRSGFRFKAMRPENLTLLDEPEPQEPGDLMAASQASLNEIVAEIIRGAPGGARNRIRWVLQTLRTHTWAAGFAFEGVLPKESPYLQKDLRELAVGATRVLESQKRADASLAKWENKRLERLGSRDAEALARRPDLKVDQVALVYLITHATYGAAKIGVSDIAGSRLAQHRRQGWQLVAAFQVPATAAVAIETDVLRWWRGPLGLPPFLDRGQMPQGGWTETAATSSIDLTATVRRICNLALTPSGGR